MLTWAPKGNAYAYVYRGNIYYKPSVKSKQVFPITNDGLEGTVFNGVPDWVYEGKRSVLDSQSICQYVCDVFPKAQVA